MAPTKKLLPPKNIVQFACSIDTDVTEKVQKMNIALYLENKWRYQILTVESRAREHVMFFAYLDIENGTDCTQRTHFSSNFWTEIWLKPINTGCSVK